MPDRLTWKVPTLADFCFLIGLKNSMKPYLGVVGPVVVDDVKETQAELEKAGAVSTAPIRPGAHKPA